MSSPTRRRILVAVGVVAALALVVTVAGSGIADRSTAANESDGTRRWVGTWATALAPAGAGLSGRGFTNQTIRMTVRTSIGGDAARIRFSNNFGSKALRIGRATVAMPVANDSPQVEPRSVRELTFNGAQGVVIPKGGQVVTDDVAMPVPAMQELTISIFFPEATGPTSFHFIARETSFVGAGDQAAKGEYTVTDTRSSWFLLSGIDVLTSKGNGSVTVLGDSLVDGNGSTLGLNRRWPDYLAARVLNDTQYGEVDPGVLNQGMAGNAVTHDGNEIGFPELGLNSLARFHRDVAGQTGVHTVIIALGINDIQIHDDPPEKIIAGLRQLAAQAKTLGLTVIGCTLGPFEGFQSWTPGKENTRVAVNAYIRDSNLFDAVVDFDRVLRDPDRPSRLRAQFDSGDRIHPNDAGAERMAAAFPLELFYPDHRS